MEDGVLGLVGRDGIDRRPVARDEILDAAEGLGQSLDARVGLVIQGILGQGPAEGVVGARRIVETIFARAGDLVQKRSSARTSGVWRD